MVDKHRAQQAPKATEGITDLFVLCQGLRKSSEYSRKRKTIIPRCVPNMVALHKYIISEESVFLVLHHAEGWSLDSDMLLMGRENSVSFSISKCSRTVFKAKLFIAA